MADTKISDLTALTGANVADDDEFVIVDTSAAQSKRITKTELAVALGTNDTLADVLGKGNTTGGTDISVSSGDDITFADNSKAIFGTGSDLQIYHNASNSYIEDTGTGNLNLRTNGTSVRIDSTGSAQLAATFVPTGAQTFYYNNSQKLATTTSGIDVTGTVTADGLTVDTNTLYVDSANNRVGIGTVSPGSNLHVSSSGDTIARVTSGDGFGAFLDLGDASDPDGGRIVYDSGSNLTFNTASTERLRIDSSGGVHVGGTSEAGTSQVSLNPSGYIKARKNDVSGIFDRITSDGDIVQFRKDGTTVGIIGGHTSSVVGLSVRGNASYGGIGLPNDRNTLWPVGATGNPADNFMDMGSSSVRWKDLYLSGTIQIEKGTGNVGVGRDALYANTTGTNLSAFGLGAAKLNTTGSNNTAIGHLALLNNTTASNNTAVGYQAGYSNTTGANSVYIGYQAGDLVTTGNSNTVVGSVAGTNNNFGECTFLGQVSGFSNAGNKNTFIGQQAGYYVTTGASNTILGRFNGNSGGLDIRTSSNNIVLSDGDGNPRVHVDASGRAYIGPENTGNARFNVHSEGGSLWSGTFYQLSNSDITNLNCRHEYARSGQNATQINFQDYQGIDRGSIKTNNSSTSYNTSSDYRLKENVVEITGATDRLKQLKPSRFNFINDPDRTVDGFLAHEVSDIVPEAISGEKDAVDADNNPKYQQIDQSKLVPLLTAALQEALTKIESLEARIAQLETN